MVLRSGENRQLKHVDIRSALPLVSSLPNQQLSQYPSVSDGGRLSILGLEKYSVVISRTWLLVALVNTFLMIGVRWIIRCVCVLYILGVHCHEDIPDSYVEKQRYDGWYNNLAHPNWGSAESVLTRKTPASYADGVYMMAGQDRPSSRTLSQVLMKGEDGQPSLMNRTAMLAFFGQVVSSEVLQASEAGCPIELHKIPIERCDEMYDKQCLGDRFMPFNRAGYDYSTGQSPNNPREQLNYNGPRQPLMPPRNTERVPMFNNPTPHVLKILSPERIFLLGDQRTNQNPAILAFGILFFRWHNVMAERIQAANPDWADEEVFQRTRRIVTAHLQNIILYEFLPAFLGESVDPYDRYRPDIHPGVSHVFQSAAFRFGHTLVPPGLYLRGSGQQCPFLTTQTGYSALRLCATCATWWDANDVMSRESVEDLLRGLASQLAEKEDVVLCSDVRNKLFGPLEFSRRDLGALNIMRGRDNGLPDYNTVRKCFHLPPVGSWQDINPQLAQDNPQLLQQVKDLYASDLMNIDL
ncbi:hypothetical protein Pcinc_019696 [Petrolisthes cinctipes]|uniref:Peroxidase n=1 Tax=Petrolisthes cinctipes TaxID=88211 RepID=A0AAE1KK25_PETCI|nr:hypothetical protein Pcinc_019696 [Petrolisthes cinctipes]